MRNPFWVGRDWSSDFVGEGIFFSLGVPGRIFISGSKVWMECRKKKKE